MDNNSLREFRILHSELIENYQYIEHELEGIYAELSKDDFIEAIGEVLNDTVGKLLKKISDLQNDRHIYILSDELIERIREATKNRNFWCHSCYIDLPVRSDYEDEVLDEVFAPVKADLKEASEIRQILFKLKMENVKLKRE